MRRSAYVTRNERSAAVVGDSAGATSFERATSCRGPASLPLVRCGRSLPSIAGVRLHELREGARELCPLRRSELAIAIRIFRETRLASSSLSLSTSRLPSIYARHSQSHRGEDRRAADCVSRFRQQWSQVDGFPPLFRPEQRLDDPSTSLDSRWLDLPLFSSQTTHATSRPRTEANSEEAT